MTTGATLLLTASLVIAAEPTTTDEAKPGAAAKVKMLVTALTPAGGVTPEVAGALTEAVTAEISRRGFFSPLSARDIEAITGAERQRQMIGCAEDSSECLQELAGAMGARFVVSGTLAKLGDAYQLTLQTLDTARAQPLGRSVRIARDLEQLRSFLPFDVAQATATPLPEPPSRLLQYSMMGAGGVAFLGGALATFDSITREAAIGRELELGQDLQPLSFYEAQRGEISLERGLGVGAMLVGAALVAGGILLLPASTPSDARVILVPAPRGVALVGVFP